MTAQLLCAISQSSDLIYRPSRLSSLSPPISSSFIAGDGPSGTLTKAELRFAFAVYSARLCAFCSLFDGACRAVWLFIYRCPGRTLLLSNACHGRCETLQWSANLRPFLPPLKSKGDTAPSIRVVRRTALIVVSPLQCGLRSRG